MVVVGGTRVVGVVLVVGVLRGTRVVRVFSVVRVVRMVRVNGMTKSCPPKKMKQKFQTKMQQGFLTKMQYKEKAVCLDEFLKSFKQPLSLSQTNQF